MKSWTHVAVSDSLLRMARDADSGAVVERPYGSNWGDAVARLLGRFGINFPTNWCAAAVSNYLLDAGVAMSDLPAVPIRVRNWSDWSKVNCCHATTATSLRRGDILLWRVPRGTGHVGHMVRVAEVKRWNGRTYMRTIEGNYRNRLGRRGVPGSHPRDGGWLLWREGMEAVLLNRLADRIALES